MGKSLGARFLWPTVQQRTAVSAALGEGVEN